MTVKKFSSMEHISPFSNVFHTQNVFQQVERGSKKAGFSPKDVFNEAVRMGVSIRSVDGKKNRSTQKKRVNGRSIWCVMVIFKEDGDEPNEDELPF